MKKGRVLEAGVWRVNFPIESSTDSKPGTRTGDVTGSSSKIPTESSMDLNARSVRVTWQVHRQKIPTKSPRDLKKQVRAVTCRFPVTISDGFTDVFTDGVGPSVSPSETVNIWPPCRHSPPPFLLLLPNPKSPHLQITSPPSPPNKILSHLSSCISWSFVVTTSVFWFTDRFYQFL